MRPRPLYLLLLCLVLFAFSCTNSDAPSQLLTPPGDAQHDGVYWRENDCPSLNATLLQTEEDYYKPTIRVRYSIDDDDEDDIHTIVITRQPQHGFASVLSGRGEYTDEMYYDGDDDYCGPDTLYIKVNDGLCDSNEAPVYIEVKCLNDCPEAEGTHLNTSKNVSVGFQLEAEDVEGDQIKYTILTPPAHGTVVLSVYGGDGTYTPSAGYCGPDGFTFMAADPECNSGTKSVSITIDCGDDDGDGVPNDDDDCANSDTGATVKIGNCDSGVANGVDSNGCSLADKIKTATDAAAQGATNHGKFVSAMAKALNKMVADGTISAADKDALMHCVGSSTTGKATH